ncbi:MAG: hypothetical protein P8Y02_04165 [Deinococcales bacterium]
MNTDDVSLLGVLNALPEHILILDGHGTRLVAPRPPRGSAPCPISTPGTG